MCTSFCFEDPDIIRHADSLNPQHDIETINLELIAADRETVAKRAERAAKMLKSGEKRFADEAALGEKLLAHLDNLQPARTCPMTDKEREIAREWFLLTTKPVIYACNIKEDDLGKDEDSLPGVADVKAIAAGENAKVLVISAKIEEDIAQMDDETLFGYVEQSIREQVTEQYAAGVQARLSNMTSDQLAMALDLALEKSPAVTPLTSEQYSWLYDNYMPATVSNGTYEDNLKLLGDVDLASPKTINIYASTFADKDAIADAIEQYNSSVSEDDQIDYTDYVALLMSSVTTIINAISYVLIAFVAISLVVSSIMIGIITYISVLERTKEIGILRAIGASKRDISRVFNAETLIEGFCSGAIGIGITLLLIIPINLVVHHLTGIESLNAILPPVGGAALVVISMALTFIAGLIPSGIAARKDPVEALRTE